VAGKILNFTLSPRQISVIMEGRKGVIAMALINGCQEGKGTPRLAEVLCPRCGRCVEVFVRMGGAVGKTGTLVSSETCECGYVLAAGSPETDFEKA
jgi:hypothetical protein